MAERLEFVKIEVKDFINQYFYRYKILENEFEKFKESLINYIEDLEKYKNENEDSLVANCLSPFFKSLNFETKIKSKMKGKSEIDLSIVKNSAIQIIIEAKKPNDKDFFYSDNPNCKALHEAILYYFRIREENNFSIKYVILTDFYKFYIFEAKEFEKVFYRNKDFEMLYKSFTNQNSMFDGRTEEFYLEAKKILECKNFNLKGSFVDLSDISDILKNDKNSKNNFKTLKPYFKILSKDFLLQEFNPNDANELNKGFYDELLHILGLSEKVINGKTLIVPSKNSIDREGTLYYNILQRLPEDKKDKNENEINEKVLEILIIWINRILFLKLLESSLINFNNDKNLGFLNIEKIKDYNKLNYLFFNILAKNKEDRENQTAEDLAYLPYLNSSLFTRSKKEIIDISQLSNLKLEYFKNTQIKDNNGKSKRGKEEWLKMIFEFLNSFDFGARDDNENILAQKDLINSSVLGLVFEKLNGYKEGSYYTPSFITSYMCKESLEKVVLQKFKDNGLNAENLDILQKQILANMNADFNFRDKAINILETIRICDPAVGSGHFLVSALNETVYIYYKLWLINIPISDLRIENDEILIKDLEGKNFEYFRPKLENDNHKIQREIFNLKKSIIENNLFGVDINPNSCEITKLRLWIELLKNSYYLSFDGGNYHNLQTLPNIDINIKCGNSLISNIDFGISKDNFLSNLKSRIDKSDMFERETLKRELENIEKELPQRFENAKAQAKIYKNSNDKTEAKKSKDIYEESILYLIKLFKRTCNEYINFYQSLHDFFYTYGYININNISNERMKTKLKNYIEYFKFHEFVGFEKKIIREVKEKELSKIKTLMQAYEDFESKKTFEWRFEFPEVLDNEGNFTGFDLIIGNPPYIRQEEIKELKPNLEKLFSVYKGTSDIYTYFYEQGFKILKDNGILNFITSNKFTRAGYGEPLRDFLLKNTSILEFVDLNGIKVFASATVDTSIVMFRKKKPDKSQNIFYANPKDNNLDFLEYSKIEQSELNKDAFIFGDNKILNLKKKIEKIGIPLKDWDIIINSGIKTGYNNAFVIDEETKDKLIKEDKKSAEIIKPILRGRDIKRYSYDFKNLYLINTHNGLKEKNISPIDINKYPAIKKHLDKYYSNLKIRQDKGVTPYNLRDCTYLEDFEKPKIIYPNMNKEFIAVFDKAKFFTNQKCFIIISNVENLKYLTGLLNSKLNFWYFKQIGATLGAGGYEMSKIFVEKLPIPKVDKKMEKEIVGLVDEILKIKNRNANEGTVEIEREIDRLVYRLYDLTDGEIEIIEGKN